MPLHMPAHAVAYMSKKKKFREHFRDNNWRISIPQTSEWLTSNIWLSSSLPITTPVFTDFTPARSRFGSWLLRQNIKGLVLIACEALVV